MRTLKTMLATAALLALGACEDVKVDVNCVTVAEPAVECEVKQVKGKSEVEACWDFSVTCANGTKVVAARTCQKVKDGATEKVKIPADKLTDVAKCDKADKAALTNLTLNGKPAETGAAK